MNMLGFVSAILPDQSLEQVIEIARDLEYDCVELMCWPHGKAERRYAGVTHIDVDALAEDSVAHIHEQFAQADIQISSLGYYPNLLTPNQDDARRYFAHLQSVIRAAALLGVGQVNTFAGRDPSRSIDANWPKFLQVWRPLVELAEQNDVRIGVENCPMLFTQDEWPGGTNLAVSPAVWRRMFHDIPSDHFGLNYDPSHLVWQHMDYISPLSEFADRIFHVHAKDVKMDLDSLNDVGILATPLEFHTPRLPGRGQIDWRKFFSELAAIGYHGPICVEVEDREYEETFETRIDALRKARKFLLSSLSGD